MNEIARTTQQDITNGLQGQPAEKELAENPDYLPSPYSTNHLLELSENIWRERYKADAEQTIEETFERVCSAVLGNHPTAPRFKELMLRGVLLPAGRIIAGAGTDHTVTSMNCFVQEQIADSMEGIMSALKDVALTMSYGGGVGTSFSTVRPKGAQVVRKRTFSSGTLPFMQMWDSMSKTIRSAGERRGAMMATLADDHPDIEEFIAAKHTAGELTQFNCSVLISDAFLQACEQDLEWELGFWVAPAGAEAEVRKKRVKHVAIAKQFGVKVGDELDWYVYKRVQARELWNSILQSTYEYSEPGVIFIDRVNQMNPLSELEYIDCVNPCGEQPLPGGGACNLGAINLLYCVKHPFTEQAEFDYELLQEAAHLMTIFLDKVLDCTQYPLESQAKEARLKRRIGVGVTGLAHTLLALGHTYGDLGSLEFADQAMQTLVKQSYRTSIDLAKELGSAPLLKTRKARKAYVESTYVSTYMSEFKEDILKQGIRNCLHSTVAPTGTISLFAGNVSSGIEPVFAYAYSRKVTRADEQVEQVQMIDPAITHWNARNSTPIALDSLPQHFVSAQELPVKAHVAMLAMVSKWCDAAVSKTINLPEQIDYAEFANVYSVAYSLGCKSCTTYRPSAVRGSVLETSPPAERADPAPQLYNRAKTLQGETVQVSWRGVGYYIVINRDEQGKFREVFVISKNSESEEWIKLFCRQLSALARHDIDPQFMLEEMQEISSSTEGCFFKGRYYHSLAALIGKTIQEQLYGVQEDAPQAAEPIAEPVEESAEHLVVQETPQHSQCPSCHQFSVTLQESCQTCFSCGWSKC